MISRGDFAMRVKVLLQITAEDGDAAAAQVGVGSGYV
jgi:hypothetical protein